jgi:transposase
VHVKAEGKGKPLVFLLTGGERHESRVFEELMECGKVGRPGPGRPRLRSKRLVADKAYSSHRIRSWLKSKKIQAIIPRGRHEKRPNKSFDKTLYKERNRVERLIARLKQFRRNALPATRRRQRATLRC